jgi:hypothetical protein
MFPNCCNLKIDPDFKRVRLNYVARRWGVVKSEDNSDSLIAVNRLEGKCAIFGESKMKHQFIVDTGAPFTIISHHAWKKHRENMKQPAKVNWESGLPLNWGGTNLEGEFHWVDIQLAEFEHEKLNENVLNCHVLAFCLTNDQITALPAVLLGLGGQGIESRGLCINLSKGVNEKTRKHDAWLIDVNKEPANVV